MQALSGMRVLEISQYEAGPTCCQLLAWLGAEVIKIEQPGGEPGRHVLGDGSYNEQYFFNYNSNKKNIVIDYKNPQGIDVVNKLIAESDILVENLGPGVMDSLGLGYDNALRYNESIIYASIKGFGLSGPFANFKSFDPLAQSAAALFSLTGEIDGKPMRTGGTFADTSAGMVTALAVTAAYVQKMKNQIGQHVEISMQETALQFIKTVGVLDGQWGTGVTGRRGYGAGAPSDMFQCSPGGPNDYIYMLIGNSRMWDLLCTTMNRLDLLSDQRFFTSELRKEHSADLQLEIEKWTMERTKFDAMEILGTAGIPCCAIYDTLDVFNDNHLRQRNFIKKFEQDGKEYSIFGQPFKMSQSNVEIELASSLGEQTKEVLRDILNFEDSKINDLYESKAIE
tara:strand:- start:14365 stop:15552 length:1188 start_codon:yes stop_codon:yes gene_type:complete